jgi:Arc/MetJ-type ribon-helix-helix transcriptional regulator
MVYMNAKIYKFPENPAESEKITINLGFVDLGHIDLLVRDGFYSNRTDFIRTSIRNQLSQHSEQSKKSINRQTIELGLRQYSKSDLEALQTTGEMLRVKVLGLVTISSDVSPSLALATIESITVLGALHASKEVKIALADRII